MGVVGLSTFMDDNPDVFVRENLRDTTVLIDGNNLFYHLHLSSDRNLPCKYGGSYDDYARVIAEFFDVLRRCDIRPFVVFDGSYNKDDRKLSTTLKRARDRIHVCTHKCQKGQGQILPILAKSVFVQTLDELGVCHMTCDFEADERIAALAMHWKCPVISKDSDFYIYDLPKGYIPIGFMNTNVRTDENGACCLSVYTYYRDAFAKRYQFDAAMVPLLATLLGNDVVSSLRFQSFYAHLSQARKKTARQKQRRIPNKNVISVVEWLRHQVDLPSALDRIVLHQKKAERDKTIKDIEKSMQSYSRLTSRLHLYIDDRKLLNPELTDYFGNRFPDEYVALFRAGKLAALTMNAAVVHRVMLLCQMEDYAQSSSYVCSSAIRRVIYGILLSGRPNQTSSRDKRRFGTVEEYDRVGKQLVKRNCAVGDCKIDLDLTRILELDSNRRSELVLGILGVNAASFDAFPVEMLLYFAIIVYWVKNATPKVTRNHLRAVIVCWMKMSALDTCSRKKKTENIFSDSSACRAMLSLLLREDDKTGDCKDLVAAVDKLKRFELQRKHSSKDPFEVDVVHGFAQLQTVVLAVTHLNQLFLQPFDCPNPAVLFNGTFAYNVCRELMSRKQPDLYVSELLGRQTAITDLYKKMVAAVVAGGCLTGEGDFADVEKRKKPKKMENSSSNKKRSCDKNAFAAEVSDSNDEARMIEKASSLNEDVTNRFALLDLDSDSSDKEIASQT
ncbi:single-strand DNA endonuclease ASTE1-like [Tubulanus polymorphus]|uniref:single-strand DNA endonuclease ASTE1-like n=1 Tax=Tubulanus polymorphus TaxID=672921 RepID=UPI003DA2A24C